MQPLSDSPNPFPATVWNAEDSDANDCEDIEDYTKGGYHPVKVNDVYHQRYRVLKKLGWGHFSVVWLAKDLKLKSFVALKIVKSASQYTEAALDEVKILKSIRSSNLSSLGREYLVQQLDDFRISGPNGTHVVMVFEVLGSNLLKLIRNYSYHGVPLPIVKRITRQILEGLHYLHCECEIIHTDIKPENVMFGMTPAMVERFGERCEKEADILLRSKEGVMLKMMQDFKFEGLSKNQKKKLKTRLRKKRHQAGENAGDDVGEDVEDDEAPKFEENSKHKTETEPEPEREPGLVESKTVKIVDLGNACFANHHFTDDIQTRQYRSPEVLIGAPYGYSADIWSTACLVFELITGDYLFDPHSKKEYSRDEDHLALIMELVGKLPRAFIFSGKYSQECFNRKGELKHIRDISLWRLEDVFVEKYGFSPKDAAQISDFLLPMLRVLPDQRATAAQCLLHPWLAEDGAAVEGGVVVGGEEGGKIDLSRVTLNGV
eukprot:Sdes_comp9580_c0_seq1m1059